MMRRITATILSMAAVGAALLFVTVGHAAGITPSSTGLGAGRTAVIACDTNGVTVVQVLTGTNVTGITVGAIDASCGGETLSVTVNNGTTNSTGTATVPAGGGSVTATLAAAVAFKDAYETDLTITGP
jgi:hypothetical protein